MKKADLAAKLHDMIGGTKTQSEQAIQMIFDVITETLAKGEEVNVAGFGKFVSEHVEAREAFNPRTREKVMVPAKNRPKFRASETLKKAVN